MKIQDLHAIYINLEKDKEKNKRITQILSALKVKHTRQEAVYGKQLSDATYRNKTAFNFGVHPSMMDISFWMNRSNFKTMTKYQSAVLPKVGAFLSHTLAIQSLKLRSHLQNILLPVNYCLDAINHISHIVNI